MLPFLEIAGLKIPMYSLMIVIGVFFGGLYFFLVTFKEEKFSKLTLKRFFLAIVLSSLCLIVGAALFDSLFHSIEEGEFVVNGITWLGGVVVGFPAFVLLTNLLIPEAKGKAMKFVSLIIPSIVLAHAFGRIGCFFGGCCYGKVTDSILGVKFPFLEEKVLPTQLFESIFDFILFAIMAILRKRIRYHNFEIYFMAYGVFRFFNEFLRGDDRGATSSILSPAQLLSIIIVVVGIIITYQYYLKDKVINELSFANRAKQEFLFVSQEDYKLSLSWRNGAIILTSLVLVLFLASCGENSFNCGENCGYCWDNCTLLGCICRDCFNGEFSWEKCGKQVDETGVESTAGYNIACGACGCVYTGGCVIADQCVKFCSPGSNVIKVLFSSMKNSLGVILSFAKDTINIK